MKTNRNETDFSLKYFQYLAILFSEYYFEKLALSKVQLLQELNGYADDYCAEANINAISFEETDLQKLAYWMATGSGKTLLMHINYW